MTTIKINNIDDLAAAAQKFVDEMGENRIFAFYGKMGAGKTTFIKAICEVLGVEDFVTSPTFAIVKEYKASLLGGRFGGGLGAIYHFDFYRIKNLREAYDIGCEEYFYSGSPCFIEWPELVEELLPDDTVCVNIEVQEDGSRIITMA